MTRLLLVAAVALFAGYIAVRCPSGCYCVKRGWVWRCDTCGHLC